MANIKMTSIAGTFFAEGRDELLSQILLMESTKKTNYFSRFVISPHAGYYFSGKLAYRAIDYLDRAVQTIFVIAPSHKVAIDKTTICDYSHFQTPLGLVEVNLPLIDDIKSKFDVDINNAPYDDEHAIEIQLPLIQNAFKNVKIVPVLSSPHDIKTLSEIIKEYYKEKSYGFVISSDLSHFMPDEKARKIDLVTAQMIEAKNVSQFRSGQACNAAAICASIKAFSDTDFDFIRVGLMNSSDVTEDKNSVVGYGAWFLYEGSKNEFLNKHYKKAILNICQTAIKKQGRVEFKDYPAVFDELGACFVTLEIQSILRGCIGTIVPYRPLVLDLIDNSVKSAYHDPRFAPLNEDEFKQIDIKVSLLSSPVEIEFKDEIELLEKIECGQGLIIQDNEHQAVYLPSVWEQIADKNEFLRSLKKKAGLLPDYFSPDFRAFRFSAEYLY